MAPRSWLRISSPRSATCEGAREDRLGPASGRRPRPARRRRRRTASGTCVRQPSASVVSPFITARARTRWAVAASASSVGGARPQRVRLDRRRRRPSAHPAPRPGTSRPLAGREQHDLRERRQPVDGAMRVGDRGDLRDGRSIAPGRPAPAGSPPRAASSGLEALAPGGREVVDVGPLVLDVLAERRRGGRRRRAPGQGVRRSGFGHPRRRTASAATGPAGSGDAAVPDPARRPRNRPWPRRPMAAPVAGRACRAQQGVEPPAGALVPRARVDLRRGRRACGRPRSDRRPPRVRPPDRGSRGRGTAVPRPGSSGPSSSAMADDGPGGNSPPVPDRRRRWDQADASARAASVAAVRAAPDAERPEARPLAGRRQVRSTRSTMAAGGPASQPLERTPRASRGRRRRRSGPTHRTRSRPSRSSPRAIASRWAK